MVSKKVKELSLKLYNNGVARTKADAERMAMSMIETGKKVDSRMDAQREGKKDGEAEILEDEGPEIYEGSRKPRTEKTAQKAAKPGHKDESILTRNVKEMHERQKEQETKKEDFSKDKVSTSQKSEIKSESEETSSTDQKEPNEVSTEKNNVENDQQNSETQETKQVDEDSDTYTDEDGIVHQKVSQEQREEKMKDTKESKIDIGSIFKS